MPLGLHGKKEKVDTLLYERTQVRQMKMNFDSFFSFEICFTFSRGEERGFTLSFSLAHTPSLFLSLLVFTRCNPRSFVLSPFSPGEI